MNTFKKFLLKIKLMFLNILKFISKNRDKIDKLQDKIDKLIEEMESK